MHQFPEINVAGERIDPRQHIEPGTGGAVFLATLLAVIGTVLGILLTYGIMLIGLLIYPLVAWYMHRKATAMIHGSGVRIGETQFPAIHRCVETCKQRLGISKDVDVYIIEANVANAAAIRYGKKNVVLLTDDLIHGCLASGNPQAISYAVGHELAHVALNHNGVFRSWVSKHVKKLGRLDEYSADSVALALVGDRQIVMQGLLVLTVGYALIPFVNMESLIEQAREVDRDKYSVKAEKTLSHPLLLNRLHRVLTAR